MPHYRVTARAGRGIPGGSAAAAAALVALLSLAPSVAAQSPALSFGSAAVESKLYDTGTAITPIVLPEATGGAGTLSYTLSPSTLPRGLTWTASTRTIAGTPTAVTAATTYTWQATDGDGDRATLTFSLRVWAPAGPAVDGTGVRLETVNGRTKYNYWPGEAIWFLVQYPEKVAVTGTPQVTLVVGDRKRKADYSAADTAWLRLATNDDPYDLLIFTYTVRADDFDGDGVAVPADALSLNGGTIRAVDGGADAKLSLGTHAVANGDATSVQMRVRDTAPAFSQSASAANRSFALNAATSTTLPRATGDGALTYAVSPALPRGLSLASASPKITGTPRVAGATTHTLTATDADGDRTALGPFTITVAAASAPKPSALTLSPPPGFDGDYAAGEVIRAFVSFDKGVTVTGAPRLALTIGANTRQASYHAAGSDSDDLSFRYTVTSSDFDGDGISIGDAALTLNGGAIAGTAAGAPAAALDLSGYAVANAAGHTVRDTQPSFGSASVSARNYPKDTAVDESLPAATGGDGTLRYTLQPALPRGLSFDPAGRRIHGTPSVRAPPATYTYRATDGDGDAAALTFLLAVTDVPAVSAVRVSSSPASGDAYGALETISVEVRFDQAVTVTAPNPGLALTVGARTRSAAFAGKPNASTLRFSYRVQASDDDDDGIGVAAGALTLNGAGKLRDATGTRDAALALGTHAIANAAGHQVDTPPKISGVAITSRPTNGNYAAGDVIAARLTFTESVFVRRNPPTVALTIGANTRTATWHGGPSIGGPNTHTFAYTVQSSDFDGDGISIAAGAVTANSGFLAHSRDDPNRRALVGLGSHAIANDANHRVRDTAPTFAAAVAAQHYVAGAAASLTLPAATGDGAISYRLTGALPGGLIYRSADRRISGTPQAAAAASAQTWVATDADGDATTLTFTITVAAAGAPKVSALTFLSTPRRGATYAVGETIVAGIKFDKSVTMTGSPRLALSIGGVTRYASLFSRPSRVTRWHHPFTYTVQSVDRDTDGISIGASALSLNGGSIVRSNDASVAASLALGSFAVANAAGHKVDGGTNQPPAVRSVSVDSWPVASAGYAAGDVIRLNVGFSEPLVVTGSPRLALGIGTNTRQAAFDRAAHKQLYFRYTVQVSDHDADGISVAANALTLPDGAAVRDAAGADAALGLGSRALSNLSAHKVSTPPKVTGLAIVSTPQQAGTYTRGGVITARVTFDQSVTVTGSPALTLTIGADTRAATAAAGSGNAYVDFSYTVAAADADADGLGITGAALTLPSGAAIRDADGAGAVLDLGSYAATRFANAKVDGSKTGLWPDFGAAAGPDLSIGKNVTVTYLLDPACGPVPVGCSLAASHTGDAPLAYTVSPPLPSGLNLYRGTAVLVGAATVASPSTRYTLTVTDANGDTDTLTFTLAVTGDRPTVHGVSFRSSPAAASTYGRGEEIRVAVRFRRQGGGALAVTGSPRLALRIGSVTRQAAYYGVSGDGVLFRYAVQAADRDADGVSIAAGALTLNGGAIRDRAGNAALLGLGRHRVANHASHKVDGGIRRAPSVTGVTISTSPAAGDTYSRGEAIEVAVRFSQGVGVTGTPRLALGIGSAARYANYDRAGATSATQYFRYVVQQADVDADGLSIGTGALTLNGGAIRNNQGTNAALGLGRHAISNAANAKVNGAVNSPAIVTGVAITSRPAKGDTFRLGEEIRVRVTFSKAVVASRRTYRQGNPGWPRLALTVGSRTHRAALRTSTSWGPQPAGTTLAFHYTVQAGDYDGDGLGIAAAALDANLGSIRHGGVDANLSLGRHAVSAAAFKVDGRRPSVSGVSITSRPGAGDTYAAGEVIHAAITFDMPVRVPVGPYPGGSPTLALAVGRHTRQMTYTGSGASAIGFRYAVQAGDRDPDGVSIVTRGGLDLKGLAITAAASGNPAVTDLSGFTGHGGAGQKVDGAARPPVVRTLVMSSPQRGSTFDRHEEIGINVRFSQDLTVTGTPQLSLVIGSRTKTLNMARSFGSYLRFVYEVQAGDADADGVVVPANSLALNGGTIRNRHGVDAALGHLIYRPPLNVDGAANHPPVAIRAGFAGRPIGGVYGRGDMIDVVVNWGKRVTVTGTPQLALDVGAGTRQAALQSGNQLYSRFRYVVQSGDLDNDGIGFGSGALTLNGGSISGPGGTTANLTLPAAATDANRRVDGRILPQPAFTGSVTARTWTVGSSVSYALPAATGARGTIGYAMRQRLPDGLEFSAASRTITGTPTTVTPRATYTLQATDSATNAQGTLDFSIEITPNAAPVFIPATFDAQVYVKDAPIAPVALPAATGGNAPLSYALTGPGAATTLTLPDGISWTRPSGTNTGGTLSGTPTAVAAQATYTLTATDADDDAATLTFTLEVQDDATPDFGTATIANQSWKRYRAITAFTLPAATGGNGSLSYALSPDLPTGVTYDTVHRVSGTPSVALAATSYTWTATDADGDTAALTFTITVADNSLPAFQVLAPKDRVYTRYKQAGGTLPPAIGGDAPLTYTLSRALPAGMARSASPGRTPGGPPVDTANRSYAGAPTAAMSKTSYAWTATDADGDQAVWDFTLTVLDNGAPDFGAAVVADQSWTRRKTITAFTLPAATGGDGSVSYALSPALPAGVAKDAGHRVSGAPDAALARTEYTWTATDGDGDQASLTFYVTVADRPAAALVLTPATIDESGTGNATTVTATLDKAASAATTVTVSAAAGTNAEAGDFTLSTAKTLTIAAGATTSTGTVTITAVDNADAEPDKSVTVSGSVDNDDVAAPAAVTLTIADDDRPSTPTLYVDSPKVAEGGPGDPSQSNSLTWTVTLAPASDQEVRVSIALDQEAGTATAGTYRRAAEGADHGFPSTPQLVFPPGETSRKIKVSVHGDSTAEPDETVVLALSGPVNAALDATSATGTILDDDTPAVTLAVADSSIAEAGGTTTVTATLSQASGAATTITVTAVDGSYTVGSDATITIAAGATANAADTVTITAVDDDVDNVGDRSVTVTGTAQNSHGVGTVTGAALTLTDDEATPTATLVLSAETIDEHDGSVAGSATVTASLDRASSEAVTLTVAAAAGTNAAAGDFSLSDATTLTVAAGATGSTGTVTVTAVDNTTDAPDKEVTVTAAVSGDSGIAAPSSVTLTIEDDEAAPGVTLAVADSSVAEDGGTTTVTATLSHASSAATTITVQPVSGAYTVGEAATIEIAAGETANAADTVTITAVNDDVDNVGDRSVTVTGTAQNGQGVGTLTGASLTLTDDEATPTATLALSAETIDEHDGTNPGKATVTATLNRASSEAVTLTVAAAAGTNAAAGDFSLSDTTTLTVAAGATGSTGTVTVTAVDDTTDAPDKEVTVSAAVSGDSGVAAPASVTLTIEDDEAAPGVTLAVTDSSIAEDGGTTTVTATLSHASSAATTITVQPVTGAYMVGEDATIEIAAGETANAADSVTITAVNDDVDNVGDRSVTVSGTAQNGQGAGTVTGAALTLTDDEATPTATLALSAETIDEHDGTNPGKATVTATLNRASSEAVTLTVSAAVGTNAAAGDFSLSSTKTLSIAAGATSSTGTVTVTAVDNTTDAPDKEVTVTATVGGDSGIAAPASVTLTIEDDEAAPGVTLAVADSAIAENGGSTTVTAMLSHASSAATTITVQPVTGAYTVGEDATITIASGETANAADTVTITAVNDAIDNVGNRSMTVTGTAQNSQGVGTVTGASLTLTDDEATPTATLVLSPETIAEHDGTNPGKATVTATLNRASSEAVTLTVTAAAGTNAVAGDFSLSSTKTLSIAAGATSSTGTVTVTAVDDTTDAPDKEVTVTAAVSGNSGIAAPAAKTLTIEDDEAAPGVTLAVADSAINENGGTTTVTATLSHASSAATTITVQPVTGAYTVGSDATIEIAAGETANAADSVTITAVNDAIDNVGNRTATVSGTAQNSQGVGTVTGAALTLTDDEATPTVTLALSAETIDEHDGANPGKATVTASLDRASSEAVTLTVAAAAGTNAVAGDFSLSSTKTLSIAAGATSSTGTVTVTAVDNTADAPDKEVTVTATVSGDSGIAAPASVTLTIEDDEAAPGVTLAVADSAIAENGGTTTVTATLSHASSAATTITVQPVTGAYTVGEDATIEIASGETANAADTVTITAVNDDVDNVGNRSVTVSGTAQNSQGVGTVTGASLTLTDDEATPTATLALSAETIDEHDGTNPGKATVTATLNRVSSEALTLTVSAAAGTNAAAGDFSLSNTKTLSIAAGATSSTGTVTVTAVDDTTDAPDKEVTVTAAVSGDSGIAAPAAKTLTIEDDEAAPGVTLAVADSSVAEDGGSTTVTATLSHASSVATTITVQPVTGAYTVGEDVSIEIGAGETANAADTVTIAAVNDDMDNVGDRSVTVTGTAQNGQGVGTVTGASLTLTDDEATPTATLALSAETIDEHDGTNPGKATVTASLNRASSEALTLTVSAAAGTNAAAGDFSLSSTKTLSIAAGATSSTGTVTVTAVDDTTDAPDKEVTVTAAVSGDSGIAAPAAKTLTIEDDEAAPGVTLAVADRAIAENGGTTTVTATLSHASSATTTITVQPVTGAYTVGEDATIEIGAGETANASDTVTITAVNDAIDNVGNRTATVSGTVQNSQGVGTVTGAALTLTDDEGTPTVTLALSAETIDEHDGTNPGKATVTATLNRASSEAVKLTVSAAAGTNAAAGDFSLSSAKTLSIAAGATSSTGTVTVTAVDNTTDAPDKEVTVTAAVSGDSGIAAPAAQTLTIEDDEAAPGVTLALAASAINENGGTTTVTATLSHASSAATTITVQPVTGAYTVGTDATIEIAAGETANAADSVTITAENDAINNVGGQPVTVGGTAQNSQGVGTVTGASLTFKGRLLLNRETGEAAPGVTLAVADSAIAENGGSTTVTATLSHASSAATTITVTAVTGAYTVGSDATIEIAAGETANAADSVTITAENDAIDNVGNRTVTVSGTAQNSQGVGTVTGASLTLTDDEATPTATLALSAETIDEHDGTNPGKATVTASLNRASSEAVTLTVAAAAGTNAAAGDFSLSSTKTLSIAAGATSSTGTVTVTAVDDTTDAPDKEVTVTAAVSGDSGIAAPASVTLTIEDDEAAPGVTLAVADSAIAENGGTTTVTATLSHASSAATTITVQPVSGAYTVGTDATIEIAAGETANAADTATITAVNDAIDNVGNRTVTVSGTAQNSQGVGTVTGAALTLTDDEATPTATLVLSAETIDEHDGTNPGKATVTATLNRASSEAVTLTVAAAAGTNAVAGDFSLSSTKTLSIAAGATSSTGTVTVTAVDNTVDAPDKEVAVTAAVSGDSGVAAPAAQTLTIEDDEAAPGVTLAVADSSIAENGGTTTVTATLSHASSAATTITVTAVTGAYTVGEDVTIEIAAGETANAADTATITAVNDAIDNVGDRSVTVSGTAQNSQGVGTVTGASLTLTDDEATPTVTLALSAETIDEHDGTNPGKATVTASLNRASSEAVTLTVAAAAGTNAAAGDFSLSSTKTLSIAAGATSSTGTVTVTAVDNAVDAPDKEVTVTAAVSGDSGIAAPASVTLTIEDDEAAPRVTLAVADSAIAENGGTTTVTATLSHASSAATTITVQPVSGAYTVGDDATIEIGAGETATAADSVTITAVNDAIDNVGNRTATVSGTAQNGQGVGTVTGAALTLTDDEGTPTATLALSPETIDEHDGANPGKATVTASLDRASSEAVTLTVAAAAGTNAAAGDFSLSSAKTLSIAAGATTSTGTVTVTAVDDTTDAPDKEVTVTAAVSGDSGIAAPAAKTLTIEDDEAAPGVTLAVADSAIAENGGTTTVTATLSHASSAATTITVTAVSGAYTVGSDATIEIAAGETANAADSVTITAVNDAIDNVGDRSVTVSGTAQNSQGVGTVTGASLTLTDDEATPTATLALSAETIDEHDGTNPGKATVTASLNRASSEAVTLTVAAAAGTNAVAGDFSLSSATTLSIAAGATSSTGTVTVTAVDNTTDAPDKEVTVTAAVSGDSGIAAPAAKTLTIEDDEAAPGVTLAVADSAIAENGGSTTVTATLSHASSAATTITIQPVSGAYTAGSDATITIAAGATANSADTATITAVNDDVDNVGNRTATVSGTAQNSQGVGTVTGASLTLTDDEGAPTATLVLSAETIDEHDGANPGKATVTASLNRASSEALTLTVAAAAGTNAAAGDFSLSSTTTLTVAAGATSSTGTVTVTAVDNTVDAPDKEVTVTATVSGDSGIAAPASVTLTIEDDEAAPGVTLTVADSAIAENGGSTTVTATLSHPSSAATTITVQPVSGAYSVGSDATITIPAGATSKAADTATITAVNDAIDNAGNRTATVSGTAQNSQGVGTVTGASLTLTDDEGTPTATLALSPETIDEHDGTNPGKATVTATLNRASSEAVTLTVAAAAGTNAAAGDFSLSSTKTLSIAAGATSSTGTVTVTAVDNTADAPDKEVTVTATVSGDSGIAAPASVTLTIEDDEAAPGVTLAVADSSIAENGGSTTVTATLSHPSSAATTITVQPVTGAYSVGSDATITIPAGATSKAADTATITAVNDAIDNVGNRSVTVSGTAQNGQGVGTVTGASLTLTDDEATPTATLALSAETIDEHDGTNPGKTTVTATLNRASSEAVTLTVAATAGTNAAAGDFSLSSTKTLSIAAGATSSTGTVTVTAVDDTVDAPDKEVTVTAAVSGDSGIAAPASVTLTIEDDEAAPGVTLAVADSAIDENGGTTTVTATLSHASSAATTITVTAVTGAYTVGTDATIEIAAGETANAADTATIAAVDDAIDNTVNRTVTVSGTAQNSQGVGTVTGASLTLTDDEGAPTATLALSAETITEHDGTDPGKATVTASLNRASSEAVTLTVAAAAGTNAAAGDFTLSSTTTLSIAAGATTSTGTVTVTAVDDTVDAPDKEVTVTAAVSGDSGIAAPASVTLTIEDDEAAPGVTLAVADSAIDENGGTTTVTATLSHASSAATTITVTAVDGAYTVGTDATIEIAAGETANAADTAGITAVADAESTGDRTVTVTGTAQNSQGAGEMTGAELTLRDGGGGGVAAFELSGAVADQEWIEGQAITPLTLPAATGGDGAVSYALRPELPGGVSRDAASREVTGTPEAAQAETEYTWTATDGGGATVDVTFTIEVLAGAVRDEPPVGSSAPASGLVPPAAGVVKVTIGDASIMEGDGRRVDAEFTVKLDRASAAPVTVGYETRDDTATAGADYAQRAGTVTFAPGETERTIAVEVLPDTTVEANEEFMVTLVEPENAVLARAMARGTIGDNDVALLAIGDTQVKEGDRGRSAAWFEVRMISKTERPVMLRYTTKDGTARAGEDYEAASEVLVFAPGEAAKRVSVAVLGDTEPEADETFGVTLQAAEQRAGSGGLAAEGVIEDDDQDRMRGALRRAHAEFARVVATDAVAVIGGRLRDSAAGAGSQVTLHGQRLALAELTGTAPEQRWAAAEPEAAEYRQVSFGELLSQSSIDLRSNDLSGGAPAGDAGAERAGDGGGLEWSIWGTGTLGGYSGAGEVGGGAGARWDGTVPGGYVGADLRVAPPLVVGLAVSHHVGTMSYEESGGEGAAFKAQLGTGMTSVLPYVLVEPLAGLEVWGIVGAGLGGSGVSWERQRLETSNLLWLGAAGARYTAWTMAGLDLSVGTDGYYASLGAESGQAPWLTKDLAAVTVGRVRVLADTRYDWQVGEESMLGVKLEVGGRWDAGDAASGFGAEVGGGAEYRHTGIGLGVEASGRYLVAHEDVEFRDWGARAAVTFDPGAPGRGAAVRVQPVWGAASSQAASVWSGAGLLTGGGVEERTDAGLRPDRLDAEVSYGIETAGGAGLVTVYGGLSQALTDSAVYRVGSRLEVGGLNVDLSLDRQERPGAAPAYGLEIAGTLHW